MRGVAGGRMQRVGAFYTSAVVFVGSPEEWRHGKSLRAMAQELRGLARPFLLRSRAVSFRRTAAIGAIAAVLAAGPASAAVNLVSNGSFESGLAG
jgi:hypothetical protein